LTARNRATVVAMTSPGDSNRSVKVVAGWESGGRCLPGRYKLQPRNQSE
jgi:hypothetical protein